MGKVSKLILRADCSSSIILFHCQNSPGQLALPPLFLQKKETEAREKVSKLPMGHTHSQWHSFDADSAGRRKGCSENMRRAANQKCHVSLPKNWGKERKWLHWVVHMRCSEGFMGSFIHAKLRPNIHSMPLEFCIIDCTLAGLHTKSLILWWRWY